MSDLARIISQLKRRSWEKMRASWMSSLALLDLNVSEGLDTNALASIAADLLAERKAAEENLQQSLQKFKEKQIAARPKKGKARSRI